MVLVEAHEWNHKRGHSHNIHMHVNIKYNILYVFRLNVSVLFFYPSFCFSCFANGNCFTARESFERGINPIIIDNTNMQGWEMKPYVVQVS